LVDINNKSIYPAFVSVQNGAISAIEKTDKKPSTYLLPGFIDAHVHIESSMLTPYEFSRLASPHGSVATVSDPHEIANVLGLEGVEFMLKSAEKTPFKFYFGAPSCVPATPFETSGAVLDSQSVLQLLKQENIYFLTEMMNIPGVLSKDKEVLLKIAYAKEQNKPIDGHSPNLSGEDLTRYIEAGISTDHEALSYEDAKEKLQKGMKILIREGSAAKNYEALSPLINEFSDSLMFCSDDRHPDDLEKEHINALVKRSIQKGYDLFDVLKIACINPIKHYGLDVGMLRVGDSADFIEVKDLQNFEVIQTVVKGKVLYAKTKTLLPRIEHPLPNNFHASMKKLEDFRFQSKSKQIHVIGAIDGELITNRELYQTTTEFFESDTKEDILKIAVINRYQDTKPAISFVKGFGLKKGAIASSVMHDSHNIIAVGCSDEEILKAVNGVIENKGGIVVIDKDTHSVLPLKIAGIISDMGGDEVAQKYKELSDFAKKRLGSILQAPFMTLSFMALLVIPEIKLSDKGLFDANNFSLISPLSSV
jgi:adenine deaminase